jgi:hypothetical protein
MQVLVGFMNFYRHFIKKYAKVTSNHRFTKEIEREVGVYRGADIVLNWGISQGYGPATSVIGRRDISGFGKICKKRCHCSECVKCST